MISIPLLTLRVGPTVVCTPLNRDGSSEGVQTTAQYQDLTITDIAAPSDNYSLQSAFATDNGLYIGETSGHTLPERCSTLHKEQMVVNFQDSNIIMSGERSGAINFTDVRAPSTVHRLHHSSAVNGVVIGRNANHVIVSGLGTIAVYDLRYSKAVRSKRKKHGKVFSPTKPLVPFHVPRTHRSEHYTPGKNLAYSSNLDVAFVAYQIPRNAGGVLLYNASTGQILDSPMSKDRFEHMKGIAIARVRDGPESVFIGEAAGLHEYGVDKLFEEDGATMHSSDGGHGLKETLGQPGSRKMSNLETDRFPHDAELGMAVLWRAGDRGPS